MTRGDWELVIAGFGIPLWLTGRVTYRYFALDRAALTDLLQTPTTLESFAAEVFAPAFATFASRQG